MMLQQSLNDYLNLEEQHILQDGKTKAIFHLCNNVSIDTPLPFFFP